jgi:ribosomal protein L11 methyltransferase
MSYPKTTWELRISFDAEGKSITRVKTQVMEWLSCHGVDEFVEGVMEGLDIDNEYTGPNERDFYTELGGELLPISVYKYNREFLDELKQKIEKEFTEGLEVQILSMETSEWLEGWKESFKPIETKMFYIYPPWETQNPTSDRTPLVIEPGMAFGTGQHATTQIVILRLEDLLAEGYDVRPWRCMDVGTGTGILALAASKMGFASVAGSDIDPDAVTSAENNAKLNNILLPVWQGGCPVKGVQSRLEFEPPFDVVIANILFVVLQKIISELAQITKSGGICILSGVLVEDAREMIDLAKAQGLSLLDQRELEGWSCLTFKKL